MQRTNFDGVSASTGADLRRAEAKSSNLLTAYSIDDPGFCVETLADAMGIVVREGGLDTADAWLFRRPDGHGILRVRSKGTSDARRRFSIAHELGHWELHPNLTQGRYCTEENLSDYVRSSEEVEANCFAASLLMPRFMMREHMGSADPSFALVDRLTAAFETSRTATARRLVELTKYRVILVCCIGGRVVWRVKSDAAKYYALEGALVPADSLTARTISTRSQFAEHAEISPRVWLRDNPVANPEECFEDVRYNPSLDMSLTLLWLV